MNETEMKRLLFSSARTVLAVRLQVSIEECEHSYITFQACVCMFSRGSRLHGK